MIFSMASRTYTTSPAPGAFAAWLRSARLSKGWTGERLAEAVETSQGTISMYERGQRFPHRERAVELANALGAPPEDALEALMKDTPGVSENVTMEPVREMSDEEWELIELYRGVKPEQRDFYRRLMASAVEVLDKEPDRESVPVVVR